MTHPFIGCLTIKHFPAWAISLIRRHDAIRPLIVQEDDHIVALNWAAAENGLEVGMTASRATSLCPDATLYLRDPVAEFSAWEYVLERMNRITPFIESDQPRLWFAADAEEVRMSARYLGASIGFSTHRSTAWLASIQAGAGQTVTVEGDKQEAFQDAFPTPYLAEAGIGFDSIEGLELLGCTMIGMARGLTKRHLKLAYGREGEQVHDFLHPEDISPVGLFRPSPSIQKHFTLYSPCYDLPYVIPILNRLAQKGVEELKSHVVGQVRIVLHIEGYPPQQISRVLTHPTARLDAIIRFSERLLEGLFTRVKQSKGRVGIEKVELVFAGLLTGDMLQMSLFTERTRQVKSAVGRVHRRFPKAMKRGVLRAGAHFHEDRYSYVVWD